MAELTDAATLAVLAEMDWPDDREFSAHVEPDGYQLTPPGTYWDMAQDVAGAVISAMKAIIRADERAKVAEEIEQTFAAWQRGEISRPKVERGEFINDREWAAAIARGHAQPAQTATSATEPAPVRDSTPEGAEATTAGFGTTKTNTAHEQEGER